MRKRFSDSAIIKKGWFIDLGDDGEFVHNGDVVLDLDWSAAIMEGTYSYRGWRFAESVLSIALPDELFNECLENPDLVLDVEWEDWEVKPGKICKVIEEGDESAIEELKKTYFSDVVEEYLRNKGQA